MVPQQSHVLLAVVCCVRVASAQDVTPPVRWTPAISVAEMENEATAAVTELQAAIEDFAAYRRSMREIGLHAVSLATIAHVSQRHPKGVSWQHNADRIQAIASDLASWRHNGDHHSWTYSVDQVKLLRQRLKEPAGDDTKAKEDARPLDLNLPILMQRLERSLQRIEPLSENTDDQASKTLQQELTMVAMLAKVIAIYGFGHQDDPEFTLAAEALHRRAQLAAVAVVQEDGKAFPQMWKRTRQACANCHNQYR